MLLCAFGNQLLDRFGRIDDHALAVRPRAADNEQSGDDHGLHRHGFIEAADHAISTAGDFAQHEAGGHAGLPLI